MAIFSWRQTGLDDLTDNAEERLRGEIRVLECRIGRIEAAMFNRASPPAPPADPAPQPGLIVDPLVWRVLDNRLRWIAVDDDGETWGYSAEPELRRAVWRRRGSSDLCHRLAAIAPDLIRVTGDWREAIAERPEGM